MSNKSWPVVVFDASIVVFAMFMLAGLWWLAWNDNSDKRGCRSRGGHIKGRGDDWRCELPSPAPVVRVPCGP